MRKISNIFMALGTVFVLAALILFTYNQCQDRHAGRVTSASLIELQERIQTETSELALPDDIVDMTCLEVDGNFYIGYISIPALGIELPVMSEWSYPNLRIAPCRYWGSIYTDNLVIAAHNYDQHFGRLQNLRAGNTVFFTDVNQMRYSYEVEQVVTLESTDVDIVTEGCYPLTLFTCTYGGAKRVVVQCRKLNETTTVR